MKILKDFKIELASIVVAIAALLALAVSCGKSDLRSREDRESSADDESSVRVEAQACDTHRHRRCRPCKGRDEGSSSE